MNVMKLGEINIMWLGVKVVIMQDILNVLISKEEMIQ